MTIGLKEGLARCRNRVEELEANLNEMCSQIREDVQEPDFYKMGFDIVKSKTSIRVTHRLLPDG